MDYQNVTRREDFNKPSWNKCVHCKGLEFKSVEDFTRHLRKNHCSIEGGSFVCRYGYNSVCNSLPVDGVSSSDYVDHIIKHHAFPSQQIKNQGVSSFKSMSNRKLSTSSQISNMSETGNSQWTYYSASQNLAAVLNDPNRGKQRDFFTKTWGSDFVDKTSSDIPQHPYLPKVDHSHFDNYFKKISRRHKRHAHVQEPVDAVQETSSEILHQFPKVRLQRLLSTDRKSVPPKADVPSIFLQQDFDISKPETFHTVFPFAKDGFWTSSFIQSGKLLQEKLSHDLDQIEVSIAEQVAQKSDAFFQAMTSHDSLMEQLTKTLTVVKTMREKIFVIDKCMVEQYFNILKLERRRSHHLEVYHKLKSMSTVHQAQPTIQRLLSIPDYVSALDLISTTQEVLNQELKGVQSFRHLSSELNGINELIDKMLSHEFETYSTKDLNRPLDGEPPLVRDLDKLQSVMLGMLRRGNYKFINTYREECNTTVKAHVKQLVFEALAARDNESNEGAATLDHARQLKLQDCIQVLGVVTDALLKLLHRIEAVHDVMLETVNMAAGVVHEDDNTSARSETIDSVFISEKDQQILTNDLKRMMICVCDFAHEQIVKILLPEFMISNDVQARNAGGRNLLHQATPAQVGKLSARVGLFKVECERLCGKTPTGLRFDIDSHVSTFVSKFHNERKCKLDLCFEQEQWCPVQQVAPEYQAMIQHISESGSLTNVTNCKLVNNDHTSDCIVVGAERFVVVSTVLQLLKIIVDYCSCAEYLTSMSSLILRNLAELLTHYNGRCCQLVLGSGARQVAGLKTITSMNLILASRAVELVMWLLPFIKRHFEDLLNSEKSKNNNQLKNIKSMSTSCLDSVEQEMSDHVVKLQNKVVQVVNFRLVSELSAWEVKPPVPSQSFRNISKHLGKLHANIVTLLPANQMEELYRTIHQMFKVKLREHLHKMNIVNNGGPQHGVVTSELIFYVETLRGLRVLSEDELSDKSMNDIWIQR